MKNLLHIFGLSLAVIASSLAVSQTPAPSIPKEGTSRSDFAAQSIFERLAREVAKRSGHPDDLTAIGRASLRINFLMDSSQNTAKDFLPLFEKKVVSGILRRIGRAQLDAGTTDDQLDEVSIYPYQLKLIDRSQSILTDQLLKKGKGAVEVIIDKIPSQRIALPGEPELGHDSTGARASLIQKLSAGGSGRTDLIIQMSPTSINSDPSNPENNKKLVQEDARSGLLDGSGFVVYDDDGRYYQTDAPGAGVSASDVHIWTYGPEKFNVPAAQSGSHPTDQNRTNLAPNAGPQASPGPDSGPPIALIALGAVVAAGLVYVFYRFTLKVPVEMDGEIATVSFSRPIAVVVAGAKARENTLQIAPQRKGLVGEGLKVGEITLPLLAGGPKMSGAGGHTMYVLNSSTPSVLLTRKGFGVVFGKGDSRTETIPFKLK